MEDPAPVTAPVADVKTEVTASKPPRPPGPKRPAVSMRSALPVETAPPTPKKAKVEVPEPVIPAQDELNDEEAFITLLQQIVSDVHEPPGEFSHLEAAFCT